MTRPTPQQVEEMIRQALHDSLSPSTLIIDNESHKHIGHAGDDGSRATHFCVTLAAPSFAGQSRVACHRMVYAALSHLIGKPVHALRIVIIASMNTPVGGVKMSNL